MAAASDLQATINRFAQLAKFTPIAVDGAIGKETALALITVLTWIQTETSMGLAFKLTHDDGSFNIAQIKTSAPGLTVYLGQVADEANAPRPVVAITTRPKAAPVALNPVNILRNQNASTSLFGLGLPRWAIYAGGAVFVLSIGMLVRGRKRAARGVEGSEWWEAEDVDPDVKRIHRESRKQTQQRIQEVSNSKRAALAWLEKVGSWPSSDPDVRKITAAAERRLARDY